MTGRVVCGICAGLLLSAAAFSPRGAPCSPSGFKTAYPLHGAAEDAGARKIFPRAGSFFVAVSPYGGRAEGSGFAPRGSQKAPPRPTACGRQPRQAGRGGERNQKAYYLLAYIAIWCRTCYNFGKRRSPPDNSAKRFYIDKHFDVVRYE